MNIIYLFIEFLDEFAFGLKETAWPFLRNDLRLTYTQVGLLLSLPGIIAAFIEPFLGILGDVWRRRLLIIAGGILVTVSLFMTSVSYSFVLLLASFILFFPSSCAFVSLSQANLMDAEPARREPNMARWTFAGSLGVLAGPLMLGLFLYFGLGWRGTYSLLTLLSTLCLLAALRYLPADPASAPPFPSLRVILDGFRAAMSALKRLDVWRWLILLELAELTSDVLFGFLALYLVDVGHVTEVQAGAAIMIWLVAGLITDFLFIPVIDRQKDSLSFLRVTAVLDLFAFAIFLLVPGFTFKIIFLVTVNLFNTGWYSVLQGRLYSSLPGQSASVMALGSITALMARSFPFLIGVLADRVGLQTAMWLLLIGPLALLLGLPRRGLSRLLEKVPS